MNKSKIRISLDMHSTCSSVLVSMKRDDTGRELYITLTEDGKPYLITEDCYAVFTATKPDGAIVFNECTIDGNAICYAVTAQTTAVPGELPCEVKLYGANDMLLTSASFTIVVEDTVYNEGDEVESSDEFSALTHLISEVNTKILEADDVFEELGEVTRDENSWTNGDVQIEADSTGYNQYAVSIPKGKYLLNLSVTSSDTDVTVSAIRFYYEDNTNKYVSFSRGVAIEQNITFTQDVVKVVFYAGTDSTNSKNDTATYSNFSLREIYMERSAIDLVARDGVKATNADVVYRQNDNLYDGQSEIGGYNYTTGKKSTSSSLIRNTNPVAVDPNKGYNVVTKSEFRTGTLYVFAYDADMNFLYRKNTTKDVATLHFEGVSYLNFHNTKEYIEKFPEEPFHIMVWEGKEGDRYTEWLEYGEKGLYEKTKLRLHERAVEEILLPMNKARFDDSFNYIAYSQVTGSAGSINTAEHYKWAAKQGFTAIKGDVQPTSDGKLVMCHDNGFSLTSSGYITAYNADTATPIRNLTYAECLALQHSNGDHNNVCSFDEFVKICKKYGKIAFITLRDAYMDEVVPEMFSILDRYNMRTRCIINSFTLETLQAVREVDSNITLHQVLTASSSISTTAIDRAVKLGNCMISGFNFPSLGRFDKIDESVVAYAKEKDIRLYQGQVSNMEDLDLLMEYGFDGAQMTIVPTFD